MTGKSGDLSWTRKGYRSSCGINYVSFSFRFKSIGLWKKVGFLDRQNPVVSISGMMRSHGHPPILGRSGYARRWASLMAFEGCLELTNRMMMFLPYRSPPRPEGNNYCSKERGKAQGSNVSLLGICWGQHTRWVCLKTESPQNLIDLLTKFR